MVSCVLHIDAIFIHCFTADTKVLSLSKRQCVSGVQPWTIVQKLGEAVFIPAGCPHQVRNLQVYLNFEHTTGINKFPLIN